MKKQAIALFLILLLAVTGAVTFRSLLKTLYPHKYADIVEKYSAQYDVDADLIYAVIHTESSFRRRRRGTDADHAGDV